MANRIGLGLTGIPVVNGSIKHPRSNPWAASGAD